MSAAVQSRWLTVAAFALAAAWLSGAALPHGKPGDARITYIGVDRDETDFQVYGDAGFWFPQFNVSGGALRGPTDENARAVLPSWAGPLVHLEWWELWKFRGRSFSLDGPTESRGGFSEWNTFTLPNGETGLSGVLLDPHAAGNTSQTTNRIPLGPGTPTSFYLRVVVDNTDLKHNAISRIRARGVHKGDPIEPDRFPVPGPSGFNGIADVYSFRYDGFEEGDHIKVQFMGMAGEVADGGAGGASFAGLMFDLAP